MGWIGTPTTENHLWDVVLLLAEGLGPRAGGLRLRRDDAGGGTEIREGPLSDPGLSLFESKCGSEEENNRHTKVRPPRKGGSEVWE